MVCKEREKKGSHELVRQPPRSEKSRLNKREVGAFYIRSHKEGEKKGGGGKKKKKRFEFFRPHLGIAGEKMGKKGKKG